MRDRRRRGVRPENGSDPTCNQCRQPMVDDQFTQCEECRHGPRITKTKTTAQRTAPRRNTGSQTIAGPSSWPLLPAFDHTSSEGELLVRPSGPTVNLSYGQSCLMPALADESFASCSSSSVPYDCTPTSESPEPPQTHRSTSMEVGVPRCYVETHQTYLASQQQHQGLAWSSLSLSSVPRPEAPNRWTSHNAYQLAVSNVRSRSRYPNICCSKAIFILKDINLSITLVPPLPLGSITINQRTRFP